MKPGQLIHADKHGFIAIPEGEEISLYRHGEAGKDEWVDVCEGPHVPTTGLLRAVKLTSVVSYTGTGTAMTWSMPMALLGIRE